MTKIEAEKLVQSLTLNEKLRLNELLSSLMQARHPVASEPSKNESRS